MANWSFTQEAMDKYDADIRHATIEECARAVNELSGKAVEPKVFHALAEAYDAIRALKDKS